MDVIDYYKRNIIRINIMIAFFMFFVFCSVFIVTFVSSESDNVILDIISPSSPPHVCCSAMIASCLACEENISIEDFCSKNMNVNGCMLNYPSPPYQLLYNPSPINPPPNTPEPPLSPPPFFPLNSSTFPQYINSGDWIIPNSENNTLYIIYEVNTNNRTYRRLQENITNLNGQSCARSYNGYNWEYLNTMISIDCMNNNCLIHLPVNHIFKIERFEFQEQKIDESISRFLIQSTFGPTMSEINILKTQNVSNIFENWIDNQINILPSYHREYYRRRSNPRVSGQTIQGSLRKNCDIGSRWHKFMLTNDDIGKNITIISHTSYTSFVIDDELRTNTTLNYTTLGGIFEIVSVNEKIRTVQVKNYTHEFEFANADIDFVNNIDVLIGNYELLPLNDNYDIGIMSRVDNNCSYHKKYLFFNNTYYRFDLRLYSLENSLYNRENVNMSSSIALSVSNICQSASINFLNMHTCTIEPTCSPLNFIETWIPLNITTFKNFYDFGNRLIYRIEGLRTENSPCSENPSRWIIHDNICQESSVNSSLKSIIINSILNTSDNNLFMKDIDISAFCDDQDLSPGVKINNGLNCYEHTHINNLNVYDFTFWNLRHDGNKIALSNGRRNPIEKPAEINSFVLIYPYSHPMSRWIQFSQSALVYIGRYGDLVDFEQLPSSVQDINVANFYGAQIIDIEGGNMLSCGSPGEVSNSPTFGHKYMKFMNTENEYGVETLYRRYSSKRGRSVVWTNLILKSPDQLRQRIAWCLIQIFVLGESATNKNLHEPWLTYVDIFVRNAFGNLEDILREISYSPLMGNYLTYKRNQGFVAGNSFPDENFAREMMQLFTIGLWKMHRNGTYQHDIHGNRIETYDNDDIRDFSRIWTGFDNQPIRGNIESMGTGNEIDPMQIKSSWHDAYPKMDLNDHYIGDSFPLCSDLADKLFMKSGANYKLAGYHIQLSSFVLKNTSSYYLSFCNFNNNECDFHKNITLSFDINCSDFINMTNNCYDVNYIGVTNTNNKVMYYEFIRPSCVELTFSKSYKQLRDKQNVDNLICHDPSFAVAGSSCCSGVGQWGYETCNYYQERVNFQNANTTCINNGRRLCPWLKNSDNTCGYKSSLFSWMDASCNIQIQIEVDGFVHIIFSPTTESHFSLNSNTAFRVRWEKDNYPNFHNNCSSVCDVYGETCICNITVFSQQVYYENDTIDNIDDSLRIGSLPPSQLFYNRCNYSFCQNHEIWLKNDSFDENSIFKVIRNSSFTFYLKNIIHIVQIVNSTFRFRNPPHFVSFVPTEARIEDVSNEIDALIHHLFTHQNVPSFIAHKFIQRFVSSNPSPRYVESVANAFSTGYYIGKRYSGKYGDLKAMIYALLLDREARNNILDLDSSHGQIREPLNVIMHVMRSLEYRSSDDREIEFHDLQDDIGQQIFDSPSVFNFYVPDYQPNSLAKVGLFSPESEIKTTPLIIKFLNGFVSLMRFGLTKCQSGFGNRLSVNKASYVCNTNLNIEQNSRSTADGILTYTPQNISNITSSIYELNLLLTAGKLNNHTTNIMSEIYNNSENSELGFRKVQQLFATVPEFHVTNENKFKSQELRSDSQIQFQNRSYKAIIVLFLHGGCDSFNLIVPHSECKNIDMYEQYSQIRGGFDALALRKTELLNISLPNNSQPCNKFGIHHKLPILKQLYDDSDAAFLTNIGTLVEPLNKNNIKLKKKPYSLYSHNTQRTCTQNVDAASLSANGIFGRISDILQDQVNPYRTSIYSLAGNQKIFDGEYPPKILGRNGVEEFVFDDIKYDLERIIDYHSTSEFVNTFSSSIHDALNVTSYIGNMLQFSNVNTAFSSESLSKQFENIARVMDIRQRLQSERDMFFTQIGGFDTHSNMKETLSEKFEIINDALTSFVAEMKNKSLWDDTVIISLSDFGRTITSNGRGSDHGWSGNTFAIGGKINGSRFFGNYPSNLERNDDNLYSLNRGRFIPTLPYETMWNSLIDWFDVDMTKIDYVLPNGKNFAHLFTKNEFFK